MFATAVPMVKLPIDADSVTDLIAKIKDADAECETMHWTHTDFFTAAVDTEGEEPIVIILASAEGFYVAEWLREVVESL
jgi:hypothetical protein